MDLSPTGSTAKGSALGSRYRPSSPDGKREVVAGSALELDAIVACGIVGV